MGPFSSKLQRQDGAKHIPGVQLSYEAKVAMASGIVEGFGNGERFNSAGRPDNLGERSKSVTEPTSFPLPRPLKLPYLL